MSGKIRDQADEFFKAYQVLKNQPRPENYDVLVPRVVCLAFALELYIKHLYAVLGKTAPKTHDVHKLLTNLPRSILKEILAYAPISDDDFIASRSIDSPRFHDKTYTAHDRIRDQIKAISTGFEEWRYSYESKTLRYDATFVEYLVEAIKLVSGRHQARP